MDKNLTDLNVRKLIQIEFPFDRTQGNVMLLLHMFDGLFDGAADFIAK